MPRSLQSRRGNAGKMRLLLGALPPFFFYIGYLKSVSKGNLKLTKGGGCAQSNNRAAAAAAEDSSTISSKLFPPSTSNYSSAMLHVSRQDLMQTLDFGVPHAPMARGSDAIIIYNTPKSIPDDESVRNAALSNGMKTSASTALSNCDSLNVIFTDTGHQRREYKQCLAIIGNSLESYHLNRYERLLPMTQEFEDSKLRAPKFDYSAKLRHIPRANTYEERNDFPLPLLKDYTSDFGPVREHWKKLLNFVDNIDMILDELRVIVEPIVKDSTVVVMMVNRGQSILLKNFVCSARSRNLDISNVLVFPTDSDAERVATELGLPTYFDKINFGHIPVAEAASYGDEVFASVMFAKILTVLYINMLGYDVLFQDVDIVWLENPLTLFNDKSNTDIQKFDILAQDDGSPQSRFSPLAANSGFYFVRANEKTQYLFISFLYHATLVSLSGSHQQVMIQLLQENSSLMGLKVKVFDKFETDYFPCGFTFFRRPDLMKSLVKGESNAYIYHSSWTQNKDDKLKYLKQLGEWYVRDEPEGDNTGTNECCSAEPLITCYYSDLPSKNPCSGFPKSDPNGKDFWGI